ncbi:hypothetical protein BCV72DRAFT_17998 [Rhizopus microsporus var. microsporus]|uniref:C2H2-type domain-containing protein n=2 Tax=Rhizopus microsporus TaxID=58291 RepID=A0A1X0RTL6_RHIZD|nr:hypothetical protein BCV72DRAFT_17998 [Rhizopus microsporus var. microsporus]ORE15340.1 hypothetical protein BCV71DRAFT_185534 [Rhizopus microsporus]
MLASIPSNNIKYNDWPLDEAQENLMTLATVQSTYTQQAINRCRSSVVRCKTCHRKFHSLGNLANHHQLYQH